MTIPRSLIDRKSPYRFFIVNSFETVLLILLFFAFRHDVYAADFRFIPFPALCILALLAGKIIARPIRQYWLKVDSKKIFSFAQWQELNK